MFDNINSKNTDSNNAISNDVTAQVDNLNILSTNIQIITTLDHY